MKTRPLASAFLAALLATPPRLLAQAEASETLAPAPAAGGSTFNADQMELKTFTELVSRQTGKRFVYDESVGVKKISLISSEAIPEDQLFPLFLSVLETSGLTVEDKGSAYHIVPMPAADLPAIPGLAAEGGDSAGLVTRVFKIQHIGAIELGHMIQPFVRGGKLGAVNAFGPTNHLIIIETASRLDRIARLIQELDQKGANNLIEVIPLKHASAEELARQVELAIRGSEGAGNRVFQHMQQVAEGGGSLPTAVTVVPATQSNSLIIVGAPVQVQMAKDVIAKLDVESATGLGRLNAIKLKYLQAEELAKNLEALLAKTVAKDQVGRVAIQAQISNNALLVDAAAVDFAYIRKLVEGLDVVPEQVLVELLIAEIADDSGLELGVEAATIDRPNGGSTVSIGRSRPDPTDNTAALLTNATFAQGLTFALSRGTYTDSAGNEIARVPFLLKAIAQNREVKILSKPALVAQNNKKATISVVNNIPVLRSTIQGGTGTARDVVQNIDRMDVGLKFNFTPRISPSGEVSMDLNPSIEAIIDEGSPDQPFTPTIAKREANTTVTVSNGVTVVISGLLREDLVKQEYGIPFLRKIPLIGWLFRYTKETKQKTNLLIFVTPHLVTDGAAAQAQKERWEKSTGVSAETPIQTQPEPKGWRKAVRP
jgi:general secretion pathway protein D